MQLGCIIFGVPRLPTRPCDERPPAMYGHFCLVPRVSVHDRYYCTRKLCNLLIVCSLRVSTENTDATAATASVMWFGEVAAGGSCMLNGMDDGGVPRWRPTGSGDCAKTIGYVGRASINNTTNWVCIHMVAGWTSTK